MVIANGESGRPRIVGRAASINYPWWGVAATSRL